MLLSNTQVGHIIRFVKHPYIKGTALVIDRYPEDRVSGGTTVFTEDGGQTTFIWNNEDPIVKVIGKGKLMIVKEV